MHIEGCVVEWRRFKTSLDTSCFFEGTARERKETFASSGELIFFHQYAMSDYDIPQQRFPPSIRHVFIRDEQPYKGLGASFMRTLNVFNLTFTQISVNRSNWVMRKRFGVYQAQSEGNLYSRTGLRQSAHDVHLGVDAK